MRRQDQVTSAVALLVVSLLLDSALGGQEEPLRGAKELFFDPAGDGSVFAVEAATPCQSSDSKLVSDGPVQECERRRVNGQVNTKGGLGLSYWIELLEGQGKAGRQVTESQGFKSGEKIRLHFMSNCDGAISLLQLGSSGQPGMLFPDSEKGLTDQFLRAGEERILPTPEAWFRFDDEPGTERLLVVFAAEQDQLDSTLFSEPRSRRLDPGLIQIASTARGGKDLMIETETETYAEVGTYAVSVSGKPIVLEIALEHQ